MINSKDKQNREMWTKGNEKDKPLDEISLSLSEVDRLKKSEQNLATMNSRMQHIFNALENSFWGAQLDEFSMLYVSPANEKIYGYSDKELYLNPALWYQVIVQEDKHVAKRIMSEIAQGRPVIAEYRITHKDGQIKWVEVRMTPTLDASGKPISVDGITLDITDRKNSENKILASELQFKSLVENIPGVYWVNDVETYSTLYISPSYEAIWGRSCQELYDDPSAFINAVYPDDKSILLEAHKNIAEYKQINISYRIVRPNGAIRWISAKINIKEDDNGKKLEYGYAEDVTEKKEAELKLIESEQRLLEAQRLAGIGDYNFNFATGIWKCSTVVDEIFGLKAPEIYDVQNWLKLIAPEYKDAVLEKVSPIFQEGKTLPDHYIDCKIYRASDGAERWVSVVGEIQYNSNHKPVILKGTVQDITERKLIEKKLELSQQRLLESQSIAHIGGFTYEYADHTWTCSAMLYNIAGLDGEKFLEFDDWVNLISKDVQEEMLGKVLPLIQNGNIPHGHYLDCKIKRADNGETRWISLVGTIEYDESGNPLRFKGTAQDITERKNAEDEVKRLNESLEGEVEMRTAELKQVNRELEAFNYTVSHDLQNPIRSLNGFSNLLIKEYSQQLDEEGKEYLNIIHTSAKRMSSLINDLLAFAKLGKVAVAKVNVDMNKLVRDEVEQIQKISTNIQNTKIVFSNIEPAFCDPGLMKQVWNNLIGNALKYSSKIKNAKVEIGSKEINKETVYYIRDNGAGFDMKDADKLFKVFERLHKSNEFEGTGIGLSTVERIITKHGGKIWAESKLNMGATFYFTLPPKP